MVLTCSVVCLVDPGPSSPFPRSLHRCAGGSYALNLRYALGWAPDRRAKLLVNGKEVANSGQRPVLWKTGAWASYAFLRVPVAVTLNAGSNTIRVEQEYAGGDVVGNLLDFSLSL